MKKIELTIPKSQLVDCTKTEIGRVLIFRFPDNSKYRRYNVVFSERIYTIVETESEWIIESTNNKRIALYDVTAGVMGDEPSTELLLNIKKEIEKKC